MIINDSPLKYREKLFVNLGPLTFFFSPLYIYHIYGSKVNKQGDFILKIVADVVIDSRKVQFVSGTKYLRAICLGQMVYANGEFIVAPSQLPADN